jgi:membrane-bound lytic murein transglycosylase D
MKKFWITALILLPLAGAHGQDDTISIDDAVNAANQWAKENLNDDALRALQGVDQEKVKRLFSDIEREFRGQYVVDVASVKDAAQTLLPALESSEETKPYADWLKARLDYMTVAEEIKRTTPAPKPVPGKPAKPVANPPPEKERAIWTKQLSEKPWPPAAKEYVTSLKPIFTAQNVPAELVWVAEVESSFNPKARSPVGAAGLYQLMPAAAKRFGLKDPPDERLQPEASARAAAKYFDYLHRHFKDWRLAMAAYNAGEGTVQKLLDRHRAKSFDEIATRLPAETQMYVPKIEATVAKREGVKLSEL